MGSITLNEKYVTMGKQVRRAGESRISMVVRDRGQPVTVPAIPALWRSRRRTRTLWSEFAAIGRVSLPAISLLIWTLCVTADDFLRHIPRSPNAPTQKLNRTPCADGSKP